MVNASAGRFGLPLALLALVMISSAGAQKLPVIVDTDIGSFSDDALALAYLARHPEIELVGVTTVHEGAGREPLALKLLELLGRTDVPVFRGCGVGPLCSSKAGDASAKALPETAQTRATAALPPPRRAVEREAAADWIARTAAARPGRITLLAIGPLTNVALAFERSPQLKKALREIVIMGGALKFHEPEWNIRTDVPAARAVFESGVPLTMVGLDVTLQCRPLPSHITRLEKSSQPVLQLLGRFLRADDPKSPLFAYHDPLAAAVAADRSLVRLKRMSLRVNEAGATVVDRAAGSPISAATSVDSRRFIRGFLEIIERPQ